MNKIPEEDDKKAIRQKVMTERVNAYAKIDEQKQLATLAIFTIILGSLSLVVASPEITGNFMAMQDLDSTQPDVQPGSIDIIERTNTELNFIIDNRVVNPNNHDLQLREVSYRLISDNEIITQGNIEAIATVESNNYREIAISYEIDSKGVNYNKEQSIQRILNSREQLEVHKTMHFYNSQGERVSVNVVETSAF